MPMSPKDLAEARDDHAKLRRAALAQAIASGWEHNRAATNVNGLNACANLTGSPENRRQALRGFLTEMVNHEPEFVCAGVMLLLTEVVIESAARSQTARG
jgi:hypothetical protein